MVGESLFPGGNSTSIVMGLGQLIFNGEMPDMFMSNGYLVMKSAANDLFLVLDPETGILRDVMIMNSTISGSYCYSDQQAEWAFDLAEQLLNNPLNIPWMGSIPSLAMGLNVFAPGASFPGLGSLSSFFTSVGVSGPAAEALAGLTRFARNPLSAALIGVGITTFVVGNYLCDKYGWLPPEQARQVLGNAFPLSFGLINQFLYDKESPTLAEIGNACWDAGYYLMGKTKKQIEVEYHTDRLKDLEKIQNGPSPKKKPDDFKVQAALLGQALGVALANNDIIRASTIIVVGGLWALGESIVETLQQKEKGNQTNNTTSG